MLHLHSPSISRKSGQTQPGEEQLMNATHGSTPGRRNSNVLLGLSGPSSLDPRNGDKDSVLDSVVRRSGVLQDGRSTL